MKTSFPFLEIPASLRLSAASVALFGCMSLSANAALIAYYDFDGNANDSAAANVAPDLALAGNVTYTSPGFDGSPQKLTLDGNNDWATNSGTNFTQNSPGITLTTWFRTPTTLNPGTQTIMHLQVAGGAVQQGAADMKIVDGNFAGGGRSSSSTTSYDLGYQAATGTAVSANTLYFGAVVLDYPNDDIILYLYNTATDTWTGGSNLSASWANNSLAGGNAAFRVGASNNGLEDFNGAIDEVRIYNEALSQEQIFAAVPEPSFISLLIVGGVAVVIFSRRRAKGIC